MYTISSANAGGDNDSFMFVSVGFYNSLGSVAFQQRNKHCRTQETEKRSAVSVLTRHEVEQCRTWENWVKVALHTLKNATLYLRDIRPRPRKRYPF